jgi:hypothetical protein
MDRPWCGQDHDSWPSLPQREASSESSFGGPITCLASGCTQARQQGIIQPSERWGLEVLALDVLGITLGVVLGLVIVILFVVAFAVRQNLFKATDRETRRERVWCHTREFGNWYLAALVWTIAWVLVWINNVPKEKGGLIWEPALVALSLGLIVLLAFSQIYDKERTKPDRMRAAIAATFIFIFLFLVVDLLTIRGFRDSLSDVSDVKVEVTKENGLVVSTVTPADCASPSVSPAPEPASGATASEDGAKQNEACVPLANEGAATFVEGLFGTFKWALTAIIAFYFLAGAVEKASTEWTEREKEKTKQETVRATGQPPPEPPAGGGSAGGGG